MGGCQSRECNAASKGLDADDGPLVDKVILEDTLSDLTNRTTTDGSGASGESLGEPGAEEPARLQKVRVEEMTQLVASKEGFFVALDQEADKAAALLAPYGVTEWTDEEDMKSKLKDFQMRIMKSQAFKDSAVVSVILSENLATETKIGGATLPEHLWNAAHIVPFLSIDVAGLEEENQGVRMLKDVPDFENIVKKAQAAGVFGTKARSVIKCPNVAGIKALVDQQFQLARQVLEMGMVPILHTEVHIDAQDKPQCETILLEQLNEGLQKLGEKDHVIFELTIPSKANAYFSLKEHPKVLRVAAISGGYCCTEACKKLTSNVGIIAAFGRAFMEGLHIEFTDKQFDETLTGVASQMLEASRRLEVFEEQIIKVANQDGFFVSLDSGKGLEEYGFPAEAYATPEGSAQCFDEMYARILTNSKFNGSRIIGAILREESMKSTIDGKAVANYLWASKRVVPFLRLPFPLQPEVDGSQLLCITALENLSQVLEKAKSNGICGTKMSVAIHRPVTAGIKAAVDQMIGLGKAVMAAGLLPILQFDIVPSANKGACERRLFEALIEGLSGLQIKQKVILDLPVPELPNMFLPLMGHPNVLRVSALSGGCARQPACEELSHNIGLVAGFGRAFTEGLTRHQTDEEFTQILDDSAKEIYLASFAVPVKEEQKIKVATMDGFFAPFDDSGQAAVKALNRFGVSTEGLSLQELNNQVHKMNTKIISNAKFNGSRVIGVSVVEDALSRKINKVPIARYLWEQKNIVPFLNISKSLEPEADGVCLMKVLPDLGQVLDKAVVAGIFGTKAKSLIKSASPSGIHKLVAQQFDLGQRVMQRGLTPILMIEVDVNAVDKEKCERLLLHSLVSHMDTLSINQKIILQLPIPTKPNLFMPVSAFPNCIRLVASSGGAPRKESCRMLSNNVGMVGGFSRALVEGLTAQQSPAQFTKSLDDSCKVIFNVSKKTTLREAHIAKIASQEGFFASLDLDASRCRKVLLKYGVTVDDDALVMEKVHEMRCRFVTNAKYNGSRILGTVLNADTLNRDMDCMPTPKYLWEKKHIVPILKLDCPMEKEIDGVCLMKIQDTERLSSMIDKAQAAGVYFVKMNSSIKAPNSAGIKAIVDQQFEVAKMLLSKGMVPVMQIEVDMSATEKQKCEKILRQSLIGALSRELKDDEKVVLVLGLPQTVDMYESLHSHARTMRVAAVSGGFTRKEACEKLAEIPYMCASFGRAFTEGMTIHQTDKEFTFIVDASAKAIFQASSHRDVVEAEQAMRLRLSRASEKKSGALNVGPRADSSQGSVDANLRNDAMMGG